MTEFKARNCAEWITIQNRVFGTTIPASQEWTNVGDIIRVLAPFCGANSNHMFLAEGGGLDLEAVSRSPEPGCIRLLTGGAQHVIRPVRLLFESFSDYPSMSYIRIETDPLAPSGAYEAVEGNYEEVVELSPQHYLARVAWDAGYYTDDESGEEIPLPRSAHLCIRWFSGTFVVFAKGSIYNAIRGTYDGRHNNMNAAEFRAHVQEIIDRAILDGIPE
jgi:hypothetical protein